MGDRCTGKHPYTTRKAATEGASRISHRVAARIHAYQCPVCHYWHIGSNPARRFRRQTPAPDLATEVQEALSEGEGVPVRRRR